jgi:hypothetical protein
VLAVVDDRDQFVSEPSWLVGYTAHCISRLPETVRTTAGSSGSPEDTALPASFADADWETIELQLSPPP